MSLPTRREFVSTSAALFGGGWLWLQLPAFATLSACARDAARRNEPFTNLTAAQGNALRAIASRILPSDDGVPGAEEAGAAWFVDAALAGPFAGMKEPLFGGLADLDARAQEAHGVAFADAMPEQQDAMIAAIEETAFFGMARFVTLAGTFSDPSHGGNRDHAGFALLNMEHAPAYGAPFGWYDEQYTRASGAADGGES